MFTTIVQTRHAWLHWELPVSHSNKWIVSPSPLVMPQWAEPPPYVLSTSQAKGSSSHGGDPVNNSRNSLQEACEPWPGARSFKKSDHQSRVLAFYEPQWPHKLISDKCELVIR